MKNMKTVYSAYRDIAFVNGSETESVMKYIKLFSIVCIQANFQRQ